jgi:hypothetical protein
MTSDIMMVVPSLFQSMEDLHSALSIIVISFDRKMGSSLASLSLTGGGEDGGELVRLRLLIVAAE